MLGAFRPTPVGRTAIAIENNGDVTAAANFFAYGVYAKARNDFSSIAIQNSGAVMATASNGSAFGFFARTYGLSSPIAISNSGDIVEIPAR